jgi:hypothetical protein
MQEIIDNERNIASVAIKQAERMTKKRVKLPGMACCSANGYRIIAEQELREIMEALAAAEPHVERLAKAYDCFDKKGAAKIRADLARVRKALGKK